LDSPVPTGVSFVRRFNGSDSELNLENMPLEQLKQQLQDQNEIGKRILTL